MERIIMTTIAISPTYKVTTSQIDAVKLREENQLDTIYMQEPMEKELTSTSFLTTVSEGYPAFFQMGNLYVNRERIQSIRSLNNVYYILTTFGYIFEVGTLPYTIDEMLSFVGASSGGGGGSGGAPSLGSWDASITSGGGSANVPVASFNSSFNVSLNGDWISTWDNNESPIPIQIIVSSNPSSRMLLRMEDPSSIYAAALLVNNGATPADLWQSLLSNTPTGTVTYAARLLVYPVLGQFQFAVLGGSMGFGTLTNAPAVGDNLEITLSADSNNFTLSAGKEGTALDVIDFIPLTTIASLKFTAYGAYILEGTTPPFTIQGNFGSSPGDATRPSDAVFGSSYLITGNGTYLGNNLRTGWIAQFIGVSPDSLFIYKPASEYVTSSEVTTIVNNAISNSSSSTSALSYAEDTYDTVSQSNYTLTTGNTSSTNMDGAQFKKITVLGLNNINTQGSHINISVANDDVKEFILEIDYASNTYTANEAYSTADSNDWLLPEPKLYVSLINESAIIDSRLFMAGAIRKQYWKISGSTMTLLGTQSNPSSQFIWHTTPYLNTYFFEGSTFTIAANNIETHTVNPVIKYEGIDRLLINVAAKANIVLTSNLFPNIPSVGTASNVESMLIVIDNGADQSGTLTLESSNGSYIGPLPSGITRVVATKHGYNIDFKFVDFPSSNVANEVVVLPNLVSSNNWEIQLDVIATMFPGKQITINMSNIAEDDSLYLRYEGYGHALNVRFSEYGMPNSFVLYQQGVVKNGSTLAGKTITVIPNYPSVPIIRFNKEFTFEYVDTMSDSVSTYTIPINTNRYTLDGSALTIPLSIGLNGLAKTVIAFGTVVIKYSGTQPITVLGNTLNNGEALIVTQEQITKVVGYTAPILT